MAFFDELFGGVDTSAQKTQLTANLQTQDLIQRLADRARQDVSTLFEPALQAPQQGFQAAIDVLQGSVPRQQGLFQQGNIAAQNLTIEGLRQRQNAILGSPVDFSGFQPTQINAPQIPGVTLPQLDFSGGQNALPPSISQPSAPPGPDLRGLIPHKGHFHRPDGTKVLPGELTQQPQVNIEQLLAMLGGQ